MFAGIFCGVLSPHPVTTAAFQFVVDQMLLGILFSQHRTCRRIKAMYIISSYLLMAYLTVL